MSLFSPSRTAANLNDVTGNHTVSSHRLVDYNWHSLSCMVLLCSIRVLLARVNKRARLGVSEESRRPRDRRSALCAPILLPQPMQHDVKSTNAAPQCSFYIPQRPIHLSCAAAQRPLPYFLTVNLSCTQSLKALDRRRIRCMDTAGWPSIKRC